MYRTKCRLYGGWTKLIQLYNLPLYEIWGPIFLWCVQQHFVKLCCFQILSVAHYELIVVPRWKASISTVFKKNCDFLMQARFILTLYIKPYDGFYYLFLAHNGEIHVSLVVTLLWRNAFHFYSMSTMLVNFPIEVFTSVNSMWGTYTNLWILRKIYTVAHILLWNAKFNSNFPLSISLYTI